MKKTIITTAALFAAVASFAQGTINFTTIGAGGLNAVVFYGDTSVKADDKIHGQLFWSPVGANNWTAVDSPVKFATGSLAGYITKGAVTTTAAAGSTVDISFRGWASSAIAGGQDTWNPAWGASGPGYASAATISVATGGGGSPPAVPVALTGLQGFTIPVVPEPSFAALGLLGAGLLLIRRKK